MKRTILITSFALLMTAVPRPGSAQTGLFGGNGQSNLDSAKASLETSQADLAQARQAYDAAQARVVQEQRDLSDFQQSLRKATGRLDVSPEALQKAAARLDEESETLELDEVGAAARRKALEQAVQEYRARAEKAAVDDPVAAELEKEVHAREEQLQRLQQLYKAASVPASAMDDAQAQLAQARAKLAERRHSAAAGSGGDLLSSLTHDLLNVSIAEQERRARQEFLARRRAGLAEAMNQLPDLQRRIDAYADARKQLDKARVQIDQQEGIVRMSQELLRRAEAALKQSQPASTGTTTAPSKK